MKRTQIEWDKIDWRKCEHDLAETQNNLTIAAKRGNFDKTQSIQNNMIRQFSLRALAVRKVTSSRGKRRELMALNGQNLPIK